MIDKKISEEDNPHPKCPICIKQYHAISSSVIRVSICPKCKQEVWEGIEDE